MWQRFKRLLAKPRESAYKGAQIRFPKTPKEAEKHADKEFDYFLKLGRLREIGFEGVPLEEARKAYREQIVRLHFPAVSKSKAISGAAPGTSREEAEKIVDRIIEMGYLTYVDGGESDALREQIVENVAKDGRFQCELVDDPERELLYWPDRRQYLADNEDLMDGTIGAHIARFKDILVLEGAKPPFVEDELDDQGYTVRVNRMARCIYQWGEDPGVVNTWGLAHKALMEIVNALLEEVGSPERLYGSYHASDGRVILLTGEMFDFLHSFKDVFDVDWLPYPADQTLKHWDDTDA